MSERVWQTGDALALSVGMQVDIATVGNSMEITLKHEE